MAQTKQTNKSSDAKKIKDMEKTIEELNNLVQLLIKQGGTAQPVANTGERDIVFISLCNYTLNLSTEPNGGGTIYTFNEFGEEQSIPYSDARRIIKNNKSFSIFSTSHHSIGHSINIRIETTTNILNIN